MSRGAHIFVLLGLLATFTSTVAMAQSSPFQPPPLPEGEVIEIQIEGTRRVESLAVRNVLGTQVGDSLNRAQLRRDILAIRRLRARGTPYFEDVQIAVESTDDGLVLTYIVREKPVVAFFEYRFVEGSELEDDIEEVVDIRVGDVFDLADVRDNMRKIEELYREESYFLAEVDFQWVDRPDGDVDLTFIITEYEEVEVRRVVFVGNENIPSEDLQSIIATRPGDILGFLSGAGVFSEMEFANDRRRVRAYYYDQGYIDAEVSEPSVELSRDLTEVFVTIPVVEGEQYSIRSLDVAGDMLIPADELMAEFVQTEPGDVFSSTAVRRDMERISTFYRDDGFAHVNVNLGMRRDEDNLDVAVTYDIQQGEPVYIRNIRIIGNATTRDEVIRRELRILESDLYSGTAIRISRARVERLGFFESVEIREVSIQEPNLMDLEIEVAERPTGQFQVGAGFSSVENFIATATVSQNNLFGRGQTLSLQMSISSLRTIFSLGFTEPYFFGTRWQFGFEVFNRELLYTDFTRRAIGFNVTVGHPITDDVTIALTYQLEGVDVEPGGRSGRRDRHFNNLFQGGRTSSIQTTLLWDTRNNRLFPTSGFMQRGSVELAEEFLASENQFVRLTLISRWYLELFSTVVLKFNANLGIIATTDPQIPVPIFERFFLGGPNNVRGFERATLSPTEPVSGDPSDPSAYLVGFPIGGNKNLFFNLEIEFPIVDAIGLRGVVFADAGNAFDEDQSFSLMPDVFDDDDTTGFQDNLRTSIGFGLRWISPLGPLRFEWGFPLSPLDSEETSVFEFSLGNFL